MQQIYFLFYFDFYIYILLIQFWQSKQIFAFLDVAILVFFNYFLKNWLRNTKIQIFHHIPKILNFGKSLFEWVSTEYLYQGLDSRSYSRFYRQPVNVNCQLKLFKISYAKKQHKFWWDDWKFHWICPHLSNQAPLLPFCSAE